MLTEGVDDRLMGRAIHPLVSWNDLYCRDRLPWGGFTAEDSCTCVGFCGYDREREASIEAEVE